MFFWNSLVFFDDPTDVGNLNSGYTAFFKSSLNSSKFTVHALLKPGLENFEHYFANIRDECNCAVVWAFLALPFFGIFIQTNFSSPVATAKFSKFAGILNVPLSQNHLLGFKIAQLEFHPLQWLCLQWCFLRPTWLCIPDCLALGEWSHHHDYLGSRRSFFTVLLCILVTSSLYLLLLLGPYQFCPLLCPSLHEKFPWYLWFSWSDL